MVPDINTIMEMVASSKTTSSFSTTLFFFFTLFLEFVVRTKRCQFSRGNSLIVFQSLHICLATGYHFDAVGEAFHEENHLGF